MKLFVSSKSRYANLLLSYFNRNKIYTKRTVTNIKYEFRVKNVIYIKKVVGSERNKIGDTIMVTYLPEDPSISRPNFDLKIDCSNSQ